MCEPWKDTKRILGLCAAAMGLTVGLASAGAAQEMGGGVPGQAVVLGPVVFSELAEAASQSSLTRNEKRQDRPAVKIRNFNLKVPPGKAAPWDSPDLSTRRVTSTSTVHSENVSLTSTSSLTGGTATPPPSASFEALLDNATTFNPDTSGAVGPNHVMTTLSSEIRIQNRTGGVVSTVSLDSFWSSLNSPEVFDPRVLYDPFQQRWIHTAVANFNVNPGLLLAVSASSNPSGTWYRYFVDLDTALPIFGESPNVGFNKKWIVIQANMFDKTSLDFTVSEIFTFNKANVYAGGTGTFHRFTLSDGAYGEETYGGPINAQIPAVTMDNNEETLYLLSHWLGDGGSGEFDNFGFLRVFRIKGTADAPIFSAGEYATTIDPLPWAPFDLFHLNTLPQQGTSDKISAGDCRLQNVVFRGGSLWTTQTIFLPANNPTRASVQWWELIPTEGNSYAAVFQFGRIDDPTGATMYAYPSVFPNKDFDAVLGFTQFSSTTYPSAAYVFKTDEEPNEFRPSRIYKPGQHSFSVFDGDINRWGDWSATMVDPVNDLDFWTLQEYGSAQVAGEDRWGTWWARVSPPVDLIVTMTDSPDPVVAGDNITYSITITNKHNFAQQASGIRLTNILPAGLSFVSANASQGTCAYVAGVISCDLGTLAASNRITATLVLKTTTSGQLANSVTVSANGPDVNPADNTATATTSVNPSADVAVMAAAAPNPVNQNDQLTYTLTILNHGPSGASNVRLTNTLPAGVTYLSATASQGSCSQNGQTVTCTIGTMGSASAATVAILVRAGSGGTVNNQAKVGSANPDPNLANNTTNTSVRINALPVLGSIANMTIDEDSVLGPITFSMSDVETPSSQLNLTVSSSDTSLIPNANLVLGGTGSTRTLTVTPAPNQSGVAVITRSVTDNDGATVNSPFTLTVRSINDPPVISPIANQQMDEDGTLGPLAFTIGDVETSVNSLSVSRTSSNTTLIPTTGIVLGGSGANRTVTITPAPNRFGTATVTISVGDGTTTTSRPFTVTVASINDLPTISAITDKTISEDVTSTSYGFTVSDQEDPNGSLLLSALSSNPGLIPPANVSFGGTGSSRNFRFTSAPDQFGSCVLTIVVSDLQGGTNHSSFTATVNPVNDPPTLASIDDVTVNEDAGSTMIDLTGISAGPANESESVTLSASSSRTSLIPHPSVVYNGSGSEATLIFQPVADANGSAVITVTADDDQASNSRFSQSFTVVVTAVNDPPTVTPISDQVIDEDTATDALSFTMGDLESGGTRLSFSGSAADSTLVPASGIRFSGTGSTRRITVTPAPNQNGVTTITITVSDGEDETTTDFRLTVNPINDPPALAAIGDVSTDEDIAASSIPIVVDDLETTPGQMLYAFSSSNPGLIPVGNISVSGPDTARVLTVQPALNQSGSAIIGVTVTDEGGATASRTFDIDVAAVNDPPTLNNIPNVTRAEDSGSFTVNLSGITSGAPNESQTLLVSASSAAPALLPHPSVSYSSPNATGMLTLRPATNANGTVVVTVTVDDRGTTDPTFSRTFNVEITSVNDLPMISAITPQTTPEDTPTSAIEFTVSDVETVPDNLSVSAFSSNEELVLSDDIAVTGTGSTRRVTVQPLPDQFGSASIFLVVDDGNGGMANSSFELTVTPVNDPPTMTPVSDRTINEDQTLGPIAVTISDLETPAGNLQFSAASSNQSLLPSGDISLSGTEADRMITLRPVTNQFGNATVTLSLSDGVETTLETFQVMVRSVNDAPTLNPIASFDLYLRSGAQSLSLGGIGSGASNETQSLTVTAASANTTLVPNPAVAYTSPNTGGTLTFNPPTAGSGSTTVTVTVRDDGGTANGGVNSAARTFTVRLLAPPVLQVQDDGSDIIVSWPATVAGFQLESRSQPDGGAWLPVPQTPVTMDGRLQVTIPATDPSRFFQLRRP